MRSVAKTIAGVATFVCANSEAPPTTKRAVPGVEVASPKGSEPADGDLAGPQGGLDVMEIGSPFDLLGSIFGGPGPKVHHVDQGSEEMKDLMQKNPQLRGGRPRPHSPFEDLFGGGGPFGSGSPFGPFGGPPMPFPPFGPLGSGQATTIHKHKLPNGMNVVEVEFHLGGRPGANRTGTNPLQEIMNSLTHQNEDEEADEALEEEKKTMKLPQEKLRDLADIFPLHHSIFHDIKMPSGGALRQNLDELHLGPGEQRNGANPMTGSHDSFVDPILEHFIKEANQATPVDLDLPSLFKEVMHMGSDLDQLHKKQHQLEEEKGIKAEDLLEKEGKSSENTPEHPCADEVTRFCSNAISRLQCLRKLPQNALSTSCLESIKKSPAFSCATDLKQTGCARTGQPLACLHNKLSESPQLISADCAMTLEAASDILQLVNNTPINVRDAYERQQNGHSSSHPGSLLLFLLSMCTLLILVVAWILHRRQNAFNRAKKRAAFGLHTEQRQYEMKESRTMD